jgi:tripartite ATP-independent transporter DctM subunit
VVDRVAAKRGYKPTREKPPTPKEFMVALRDASWALVLPLAIIGGIRFGVFTPTEAGAMAVVYSFVVGGFIYKELKWKHIPIIIQESLSATAAVMLIIAAASAFGWFVGYEQLPQQTTELLTTISDNPMVVLLILNIAMLIAGMFMEGTAIMIIVVPLLMPTITQLGIDPVHFGIVLVVNLTIGAVTPPLGTVMYTTCAITRCPVGAFNRENWPFLVSVIVCLLLLTYIPELSLFLPRLLMG